MHNSETSDTANVIPRFTALTVKTEEVGIQCLFLRFYVSGKHSYVVSCSNSVELADLISGVFSIPFPSTQ